MPTSEETIIFDHPNAPFNRDSIVKQILKQRKKFMLYLKVAKVSFQVPERSSPTGITDSWFIALDCFGVQQFPATILFASISVETLLNHDKRLHEYRQQSSHNWLDLNLENLKLAKKVGINISDLLDRDGKHSEFITRRNKIAHGDLAGYFNFLLEMKPRRDMVEKIVITQKQALNQLVRSFNFITKWAKSEPSVVCEGVEEIRSAV